MCTLPLEKFKVYVYVRKHMLRGFPTCHRVANSRRLIQPRCTTVTSGFHE